MALTQLIRNKLSQTLGYFLVLLCSACQSEPSPSPSLNLDLAACLSSQSNGCQDQLYALHQGQESLTCLLLKIDNELSANIPVTWSSEGRLQLSETPDISLVSGQKLRASLIFAQSVSPLTCEAFTEDFEQKCDEISACVLKLNSQESQLQDSQINIDFRDGLGTCNNDFSQIKIAEAQASSLQLFQEIYNDDQDNDCDGNIDEFISEPCTVDIDACSSNGQTALDENGTIYCDAPMIAVSPNELCGDAIDNDCDGNIDEGFMNEGGPCTPESGVEASGRWVCLGSNPSELTCRDRSSALATDICNGFDDNANGEIDEDATVTEVECMNTMCATEGLRFCENGTYVTTCRASAEASSESETPTHRCDGYDNDCDGEVDEDFMPSMMSCGSGACSNNQGMSRCVNGVIQVECEPLIGSSESCDEIDNDCDGQTDEEVAQSLLNNDPLNCGACGNVCPDQENVQGVCQNGQCGFAECDEGFGDGPGPGPCDCPLIENLVPNQCCQADETQCDGFDNDCDGQVDEGVLNACGSCNNLVESCDPFDNDCDGQVDEGNICGSAISTECTAWFTHQRQIGTMASYIVSDTVAYQDRNTHFIPLKAIHNNEFDLFPKVYGANQGSDWLMPQLACNTLSGPWKTWIETNCRTTVIWGDRSTINPWNCQDSALGNSISSRCNVSSMVNGAFNPIRSNLTQISFGLSCQDPSNGQDPQGAQSRDRILNELHFKLALVQIPANGNSSCSPLDENTLVSLASCNDGFRGDPVTCGLASSRAQQGNIVTDWSTINLPILPINESNRCHQFLFARSLSSSIIP